MHAFFSPTTLQASTFYTADFKHAIPQEGGKIPNENTFLTFFFKTLVNLFYTSHEQAWKLTPITQNQKVFHYRFLNTVSNQHHIQGHFFFVQYMKSHYRSRQGTHFICKSKDQAT